MARRLYIFFHVAKIGPWQLIVSDMVERMKTSGLWEAVGKVRIGEVGLDTSSEFVINDKKCEVVTLSKELSEFEAPTLRCLSRAARADPKAFYLYVHTKGVTTTESPDNIGGAWRNQMLDVVVGKWRECVALLDHVDACGAFWRWMCKSVKLINREARKRGHFAGNFWWARGDYLATLPALNRKIMRRNDRFYAERWIGTNFPRIACLHRDALSPEQLIKLQSEAVESLDVSS